MSQAIDTDVLIVGGGVVGLACAHYLVQAGREVCIVERDGVGSGASHGNCGLVVASYLLPLCVPGAVRKELPGLLRPDSPLYIRPALDPERHRAPRGRALVGPREAGPVLDRGAGDREHAVARAEPGLRRRRLAARHADDGLLARVLQARVDKGE